MNRPAGAAIRDLLRDAARQLTAIGAGNPRLEAEYLLSYALQIDRWVLLGTDPCEVPRAEAVDAFTALLVRRLRREPLQYVLGTVPFAGLDLVIGPGALIPRGETEILVERVASELRSAPPVPRTGGPDGPRLLVDVGTGSGAILLALLARLSGWRGVGIDRSPQALIWAARNLARHSLKAGSLLLRGDLLEPIRTASAGAVVANPPYVRSGEIDTLAPEIRDHEPVVALDGGLDGLGPFRRLVPAAERVLVPGGLLAVELAPDQPAPAAEILAASGSFRAATIHDDLAGRHRCLLARRA